MGIWLGEEGTKVVYKCFITKAATTPVQSSARRLVSSNRLAFKDISGSTKSGDAFETFLTLNHANYRIDRCFA